ncbi:peptidoglycan DD-metalloendopeptidase family protein [bacterium]|nr:peptidoglycan DD-metalloendopeptidase family protein [bacterium]
MKQPAFATALLMCAAMAMPGPAWAIDRFTLERVQNEIQTKQKNQEELEAKASKLGHEMDSLRGTLTKMADKIQRIERRLSDTEKELGAIDAETADRERDLATRSAQLEESLAAMLRFSQVPPEAWVALPGNADDAVRSAILLGHVTGGLQEEANQLREKIRILGELRQQRQILQATLEEERKELLAGQTEMAEKIQQRQQMHAELDKGIESTGKELKQLSSKAKDLSELLAAITKREAAQAKNIAPGKRRNAAPEVNEPETASVNLPKGGLRLPAQGKLVSGFGAKGDDGMPQKGIRIATRPGAQVVSPMKGEVVYTGPFMGYGNIIIIRHTDEMHTLIAGLGQIQAAVGQKLMAGEPIGKMKNADSGLTKLYMELRKNAKPVDPSPWLSS